MTPARRRIKRRKKKYARELAIRKQVQAVTARLRPRKKSIAVTSVGSKYANGMTETLNNGV
ncbi:MAG TPA: hypothetical protein VFW94_24095 [Candidatus Acidoferrales bacterium]|nr:hypothetical protein [Candidatus Acidoferrales bacterium]